MSARTTDVRATHYEVTLVPRDHPNGRWYTIHVANHGRGRWIVYREHCETGDTTPVLHCLTPDGSWLVPADPSWHGVPTYGLEEALRLAVEAAPGVTVAGVRAADVEL